MSEHEFPSDPDGRRLQVVIPLREGDMTSGECWWGLCANTDVDFALTVVRSVDNASVNRNAGAAQSNTELLFFLDADVELFPGTLRGMVEALDAHPEADYAYCAYERRGAILGFESDVEWNADRMRQSNFVSTMSMMRRSAFLGFDEDLDRLQDWNLWLRMLDRGSIGVKVPGIGFVAYYKPGDMSLSTVDEYHAAVVKARQAAEAARV